jgi:hypothetical protein
VKGCALVAAAAICGCGRLGFDPRTDGAISTGDDAPASGSDASGLDAILMPDAMPAACASAIEVVVNVPSRSTTCTGFDRIDGCATVVAEEVVFRWVVPANGSYTVSSTEVGTGIIRSTGRVDSACAATSACPGISQMPYTAGQVVYFAVESQTGCMTYDFLVASSSP